MNWLLDHWQPKHKATKVICYVIKFIRLFVALAFLVIPWLWKIQETFDVFKWLWIGLAVIMIDSLIIPNKKTQEQKLVFPQLTLFTVLLSVYLLCYWHVLSLTIILCANIIIGVLETVIQISKYKTFKFYAEQKTKTFPKHIIHSFWVSAFYIIAVTLFVCGILESRIMTFIFGGLADLMLIVSIVLTISKGYLKKKDTFRMVLFLVDILSAVALMTYLIYLIAPEGNNGLQTTILTMVAAIIGGLLTLSGVAWTIRKSDEDKKEERLQQIKPFFYYTPYYKGPDYDANKKSLHGKYFMLGKEHKCTYHLGRFVNSDKVEFLIKSILINEEEIFCSFDPAVGKGELFQIAIHCEKEIKVPTHYFLKIEDVDKNEILIKITLERTGTENVPVEIQFMDERRTENA